MIDGLTSTKGVEYEATPQVVEHRTGPDHNLGREGVALMSIPRITGREARNLLDGTTPGPWEWDQKTGDIASPPYILAETFIDADANGPLIVAAPNLAETVAWLYGRKADEFGHQSTETEHIYTKRGQVVYVNDDPYREGKEYLTPDEAVDRARALLAAAEEARP